MAEYGLLGDENITASIRRHLQDVIDLLCVDDPIFGPLCAQFSRDELSLFPEATQAKRAFIVFDTSLNPVVPKSFKGDLYLNLEVHYRDPANEKKHRLLINRMAAKFKPQSSLLLWETKESTDWNIWEELGAMVVIDCTPRSGYGGLDKTYVRPYVVTLKYPRM